MGKAARKKSRESREFDRFVQPASRAEQVLSQMVANHDSVMLRSGVNLWSQGPVVYRLDPFLLEALFDTDLKVVPPPDVLGWLPHDVFVVAFDAPFEVWDDEDKVSRVFEGVLVNGMGELSGRVPDRPDFCAVPLSGPIGAVRGTFYGSLKTSGRSQMVTVTLPAGGFEQDSAMPLERWFDDTLFDECDVLMFDRSGAAAEMSLDAFRGEGTFAQGSLRRPLGQLLLQLVLYLASREPDVCEQPVPSVPSAQRPHRSLSQVRMFELGWRVGASFREVNRARSETDGPGVSGGSPRPHLRRGHWHTYLFGERTGDRQRRLKWVHPVVVNRDRGPVGGVVVAAGPVDVTVPQVGVSYVSADELVSPEFAGEYSLSPDLRGRGARAHARLQNMVAAAARERGRTPLSPSLDGTQFDVAWREGHGVVVVEVKSLADSTEVHQLRLGVGQVIEYRWVLASGWMLPVRAVLFVEREPSDVSWVVLCREEQIVLAWPETLSDMFDALLA